MRYSQVAYMPYIPKGNIEFGKLKLFPYSEVTGLEKEHSDYLDWYFHKYVNIMMNPLNITIMEYNSKIIGPWDVDEIHDMYESVACLSFLSLWRNNNISPLTNENFTLFVKNYSPYERSLAVSSGGFVNIHSLYSNEASEKMLFIQPSNIPSPYLSYDPWKTDEDLFMALSFALNEHQEKQWFRKIIRSIRIFNTSYRNDESLDYFDRILLLVVAIQSLCVEGEHSGKVFAREIYNKIGIRSEYENHEDNQIIFQFALKLYSIRSQYSHGRKLDYSILKDPQFGNLFKSGAFMYGILVKAILRENGLIIEEDGHRYVKDLYWGLFEIMKDN